MCDRKGAYPQHEHVVVALEEVVEHALGLAVERSGEVWGVLLREGLAACHQIHELR
jgi:hypothetical protein